VFRSWKIILVYLVRVEHDPSCLGAHEQKKLESKLLTFNVTMPVLIGLIFEFFLSFMILFLVFRNFNIFYVVVVLA